MDVMVKIVLKITVTINFIFCLKLMVAPKKNQAWQITTKISGPYNTADGREKGCSTLNA